MHRANGTKISRIHSNMFGLDTNVEEMKESNDSSEDLIENEETNKKNVTLFIESDSDDDDCQFIGITKYRKTSREPQAYIDLCEEDNSSLISAPSSVSCTENSDDDNSNSSRDTTLELSNIIKANGSKIGQKRHIYNDSPIPEKRQKMNDDVDSAEISKTRLNSAQVDGFTPLTKAIKDYPIEFVISLLFENNIELNGSDSHGNTPMLSAVEGNHLEIVTSLIERCKNLGGDTLELFIPCTAKGRNALTLAVVNNHIDIITHFCNLPNFLSIVNEKDQCHETALGVALFSQNFEVARMLLNSDADPNQFIGMPERSLLNLSIEKGDYKAVHHLLQFGASFDLVDSTGETPFCTAAKNNQSEIILNLFDSFEVPIDQRNAQNFTPLMVALDCGYLDLAKLLLEKGATTETCLGFLTRCVEKGNIKIVKFLIKHGADVNECDSKGLRPITAAIKANSFELVAFLYSKGANVNFTDSNGVSPIMMATRFNYYHICEFLLWECSVKLNDAIDVAIECKHSWLIEFYIKGGNIDINMITDHGSLLTVALTMSLPLAQWLLENGADVLLIDREGYTSTTRVIEDNNIDGIKLLLEHGIDANRCDGSGRSPLIHAVEKNCLDITKLLLEYRADIDKTDQSGDTPLTRAIFKDYYQLAKYLIACGADVNRIDANGYTPITKSLGKYYMSLLKYLITLKANVNQIDGLGFTPLTRAVEKNNKEAACLLVEAGADVNGIDGKGYTPLTMAVHCRYVPVDFIKYFINVGADLYNKDIHGNHFINCAIRKERTDLIASIFTSVNLHNNTAGSSLIGKLLRGVDTENFDVIMQLVSNIFEGKSKMIQEQLIRAVCKINSVEMMNFLRSKMFDVTNSSWLTYACRWSAFAIITFCLEVLNVNINAVDPRGFTPLTTSIQHRNQNTVKYLLDRGADINLIDNIGFTPLTRALDMENYTLAKYLVERNADISQADERGNLPLVQVARTNDFTLIRYFIDNDKRNHRVNNILTDCPVCLESLVDRDIYSTKCGHVFCKDCIERVCITTKHCPTCRARINLHNSHPLYF